MVFVRSKSAGELAFAFFKILVFCHDIFVAVNSPCASVDILSFSASRIARLFSNPAASTVGESIESIDCSFEPDLYIPDGDIVELQIALPRDVEYPTQRFQQFLRNIKGVYYPVGFEIIGTEHTVIVQLSCRSYDEALVLQQLTALFPDVVVTTERNVLDNVLSGDPDNMLVVDFALDHECVVPLSVPDRQDIDPLASVIGAVGECSDDDTFALQILFLPVRERWSRALIQSVRNDDGSSFFTDAPELLSHAHAKTDDPLFAVVIRACAFSCKLGRAYTQLRQLGSTLSQFNNERTQGLIPLANEGYPDDVHIFAMQHRITHRSGMLLNGRELAGFVHLPQSSVTHPKLVRIADRTKALPRIASGHDFVIGENTHRGKIGEVTLSLEHRMRHTYVVGASGTGKSTLLMHMLHQDIAAGHGVALLDPHGDLVDEVLLHIPDERMADVVLVDPSQEEFPVGFNILDARSEAEKTLISSDLVSVFRRLSTSWGDQMNAILANGIIALLEHPKGGTLMTLRRFLVENRFRAAYLKGVQDPEIRYYWETEYPLLRGKPHASVLTRLDTFLRSKLIRYMVAQEKNKIDFTEVMKKQQIFLAKLPHGAIGEENAYLLGTLLVTALNQAAQRRQSIHSESRTPFFVYIDEFQNFVTPTMESILSGSRKFNMALTLAHQDLRQLSSRNRDVASSVLSNPCTRICFRSGDADAVTLSKGFSSFGTDDLQSLGIGQAISRIEQSQYDFNLQVPPPLQIDSDAAHRRDQIIAQCREIYGTPREEVEKFLSKFHEQRTEQSQTRKQKEAGPKTEPAATESRVEPDAGPATPSLPIQKPEANSQGRGGSQHTYLQSLIKKVALDIGYGAEIEAAVLTGHGAVDVLLTHYDLRIACEISVSTGNEHELKNVQKCLAANVDYVVVIGHESRKLQALRNFIEVKLEPAAYSKVRFLVPDELFTFLEAQHANAKQQGKTIRGYKVNVSYKETSKAEQKQHQAAISKLIVDSMRRMKE